VAAHFRSDPYVRIILPRAEAGAFAKQYVDKLGGRITWDFEFPAAHVRVIGLESKLGNISAEFTDVFASLPEYRKNTKIMSAAVVRWSCVPRGALEKSGPGA
jgi:hypothetical protein